MKLILFRHGETKEGKGGIILGRLPGNLSVKGIRESKKIAATIKKMDINPSLIISSDLKRAKDTAKIVSKILNLPVRYEKLLRERSAGIMEGKNEKEINWNSYEKKPLERRKHKGGESFLDVKKRAKKFIKKIKIKKFENKTIILISHNVFLLMLISELYKIPIEKALKLSLNGKIFKRKNS